MKKKEKKKKKKKRKTIKYYLFPSFLLPGLFDMME